MWEKNLAALKARPQGLDFLPCLPKWPLQFHHVRLLAGEHHSLQVISDEGRVVTLHSPRRALAEAEELARAAPTGKAPYLVVLGVGLGYHLLTLLPHLAEEQYLIMVEQDPEVMWAALSTLDLTELLSRPRTMLILSPEAKKAVRHLQNNLLRGNGKGLSFWGHPPSLRSHKAFYQEVVSRLKPTGKAASRPPKLKEGQPQDFVDKPGLLPHSGGDAGLSPAGARSASGPV